MKLVIAAILSAALPVAALAQAPAKPPKPKPAPMKAAPAKVAAAIALSEADLEVARRVHVGEIACELGAKVSLQPMDRPGFFRLKLKAHEFVMHPVDSRTGAIRLEDREGGAVWLQLANKSMLMSQKLGQRLADECQSPDQVAFAEEMKKRPPINILEPAPTVVVKPATATDPTVTVAPAAQSAIATPVAPSSLTPEPLPAAAAAPAAPAAVLETTPAALPAPAAPSQ